MALDESANVSRRLAEQYERRMDMARVQEIESWQDSMRSLVELQRAVEAETGDRQPRMRCMATLTTAPRPIMYLYAP